MNDYTKGILTGVSLILCFFMFVSAKSQSKNLGDITVNSITVVDDGTGGYIQTFNADGKDTAYLGTSEVGGGILQTFNTDGTQTTYLGTSINGVGFIKTINRDGKQTAYLGTGKEGFGFLQTFNKNGVETGYFGTNINNDGMALLLDRYGDAGWSASGKK